MTCERVTCTVHLSIFLHQNLSMSKLSGFNVCCTVNWQYRRRKPRLQAMLNSIKTATITEPLIITLESIIRYSLLRCKMQLNRTYLSIRSSELSTIKNERVAL